MKKILKPLILLIIAIFFVTAHPSQAAQWEANKSVYIPPNQVIDGSLYASGQNVSIEGTINGDLIVAAQTLSVSGEVVGDIIALTQTADINGQVGGNVRLATNSLNLGAQVARNITVFGNSLIMDQKSKVGWDALLMGNQIDLRGNIAGRLQAKGENIILSGQIDKDTNIRAAGKQSENINITAQAQLNGDLTYCCQKNINIANQAKINGKIQEESLPLTPHSWLITLKQWLISFLGIVLVGLAIIFIDRKRRLGSERLSQKTLGSSLLTGIIITIVVPIVAILLALSIIGAPLAIAAIFLWLSLLIIGQAIGAIIIGRLLLSLTNKHWGNKTIICLLGGLLVVKLLALIPYAQVLIIFLVISLGIGHLITMIKKYNY